MRLAGCVKSCQARTRRGRFIAVVGPGKGGGFGRHCTQPDRVLPITQGNPSMNARRRAAGLIGAGALTLATLVAFGSSHAGAQPFGYQSLNPIQQRHVSGLLAAELGGSSPSRLAAPLRPAAALPQQPGPNGCPATRGSNVKVNVNCLNLTDSDLAGPRPGPERDLDRSRPEQPFASDCQLQRLPPRRRHLRRVLLPQRRQDLGRHDYAERVHPRRLRRHRPRVLAVRRRHVGRLGHQGQRLPVLPAVQPGQRRLAQPGPVQRVSSSSAPPAPTAHRSTSPAARWSHAQ